MSGSRLNLDESAGVLGEHLARGLSRRSVLVRGFKLVAAAASAVSVGSLATYTAAKANTCCGFYGDCAPDYCQSDGGCNAACNYCTSSNGCVHATGCWQSTLTGCTNMGTCGNGYIVCCDCWCAGNKCTCQSGCICCGCCTPKEVQAEVQRLHAEQMARVFSAS